MKHKLILGSILLLSAAVLLAGCVPANSKHEPTLSNPRLQPELNGAAPSGDDSASDPDAGDDADIDSMIEAYNALFETKYGNLVPKEWGERVPGVITKIATKEKVIALTFDACGSKGDGYDQAIIDFLIEHQIPATLFISGRWVDKHMNEYINLAQNPLFEIANHGLLHMPLSVSGKSAYGISGTADISEVVAEILLNEVKLLDHAGKKPQYFRSGTAYYDEISVQIAQDLGYQVIGYNVLGDAGATYNEQQIIRACRSASPGSIILFHMNRPEREISPGIIKGITLLKENGYSFVLLSDYHDQLR